MQNFSFKKLIFKALFLGLCFPVFAQNDEEISTEQLMAVFTMRFDIAAPDTTFVETEQGWMEEATRAQIICTALPASFERVMEDFKEFSLPEGMLLISKDSVRINDIEGFLVVTEAAPPAEEPNQEHFYAIMYMRPWEKNVTLNINAVYPKSQHERLYQKMLATLGTVKKKED